MTACHDHQPTAYALYRAFRHGLGTYGTSSGPYPVKPWDELADPDKDRLIKRAKVFAHLAHLPLPERMYTAWWHAYPVLPFHALGDGLVCLWETVAAAYRDQQRHERDAA